MEEIKEKVEELVKKITSDKKFRAKFEKDPVKAVEEVIGIDLPDETINTIIETVKTKVNIDDVSKTAKGILKFFKK